ncbi:hypothetical protein [Chloroflexus sp.]|uniref:hypothetical protein n=1 Tax=Chloroflexus sp. TaxID=1904827 RepID=UPI00298EEBD9|nr:hypothetical protein [Chloroflexus sp.]MDW8402911.1 hypothetical protein [Chloroflexus sp.]
MTLHLRKNDGCHTIAPMMNNSAAIYVAHTDHAAVATALAAILAAQGFIAVDRPPHAISGIIMIPDKPYRHFFIAPSTQGWVTIWEDPRYFADRSLARALAAHLDTRSVWIEVGGNGVSWARGLYHGDTVCEERFEAVETTFYGERGIVHLAFDPDTLPEEWITQLGLPYPELHYEAILAGVMPPVGPPLHLAVQRSASAAPSAAALG